MITNGGMELDVDTNGEPDDWSHFGTPPSDNTVLTRVLGDVPPGGGTYSLLLTNGGASGPHWLWQDMTVLPETQYLFDFWYKGTSVEVHFEASSSWHSDHIGGGVVFWDDYFDQSTPNPETTWTHATKPDGGTAPWIVTTLPGQTFLRVQFIDQWGGSMYLDNVSLVEVPEPATLGVLGFGLLGFLIRRKR
jgi:hypothetical protein